MKQHRCMYPLEERFEFKKHIISKLSRVHNWQLIHHTYLPALVLVLKDFALVHQHHLLRLDGLVLDHIQLQLYPVLKSLSVANGRYTAFSITISKHIQLQPGPHLIFTFLIRPAICYILLIVTRPLALLVRFTSCHCPRHNFPTLKTISRHRAAYGRPPRSWPS